MSIYVGFHRIDPDYVREMGSRSRAGEPAGDPRLTRKVIEFPDSLPPTCKLIGTFNTVASDTLSGPAVPSVMIVETTNGADLSFITNYYRGYLQFQWHPANALGPTRQDREAAVAASAQPVR